MSPVASVEKRPVQRTLSEFGFLAGINYPWIKTADGLQNYGKDFGTTRWGTREGVLRHTQVVEEQFREISSLGLRVLRWFVFTDGRGGISFDKEGVPQSPSDGFFDDMDAAFSAAAAFGLLLNLVLLDHTWIRDEEISGNVPVRARHRLIATSAGRRELIHRIFIPLFRRYAGHPSLLAWEVMNEPEWVIWELEASPGAVPHAVSLRTFRTFVRQTTDAAHLHGQALCTVGTSRLADLRLWGETEMDLDFLQLHPYADFFAAKRGEKIRGRSWAQLALDKPLVIGEFPGRGYDKEAPSTATYLEYLLKSGYAGGWIWSYNAADAFSGVAGSLLQAWAGRNVPPPGPTSGT